MPKTSQQPFRRNCARLGLILLGTAALLPAAAFALDEAEWLAPPVEARPIARWWWPGGAVDEIGIRDELGRIREAGFGGVELQPLLLGMSQADLDADPRIRSVGTPEFARHVAIAADEAAALGLAFDLTLGSGWPGGLPGRRDAAERQLLMASLDLPGGTRASVDLPAPVEPDYVADVQRFLDTMGDFDPDVRLVAVLGLRLRDEGSPAHFDRVEILTDRVTGGRIEWQVPEGTWRLLAFYENRTAHSVLGGAYPGGAHDALVVDHLHERGALALWQGFLAPSLAALPAGRVRGVFVDSFELIGELPFTQGFREAFRTRKGYDLTPHLPLLFRKEGESKYSEMVDLFGRNGGPLYLGPGGEQTRERLREDYVEVRAALFLEEFVGVLRRLANQQGAALRLQAHGGFADYLDAYALADIPESEGLFAGGSSDFLRLASSAAHVAGRPIASSESFITLRFFGHQLDAAQIDLLAGRAFSAGINQLVHHGVPYRYEGSDGEEWYPFAGGFGRILAGPLPMTTWFRGELWEALPEINLRLARLSHAMRQGEHAADLAWLRAEGEFPDQPSFEFGRVDPHEGESQGARALRERGVVHDRVSRRQLRDARVEGGRLRVGAASYGALILDPMRAADPALLARALEAADAGIPLVVIGELPVRATGLLEAEKRDAAVRANAAKLTERVVRIANEGELSGALQKLRLAGPLVAAESEPLRFSIDHRVDRRSGKGEHILLVFNESWSTQQQRLRLNVGRGAVLRWDPRTGRPGRRVLLSEESREFDLVLGPAESVVLTVGY